MKNEIRYNEITILKVIAMSFITWFHFKWFVPETYSFIFIGGAIGNSIFFFCSGFLLNIKEEKYCGQWLLNKYIRLMPVVWSYYIVVLIIELIIDDQLIIISNLKEWLYPDQFWFIQAILFYYFCIYIYNIFYKRHIRKNYTDKYIDVKLLSAIFVLIHILWYFLYVEKTKIVIDEGGIKSWFFWCLFFLWGYYCKTKDVYNKKIQKQVEKMPKWVVLTLPCLSIVMLFAYKHLFNNNIGSFLQFMIIPLILFFIVYSFLLLSCFLVNVPIPIICKKVLCYFSNITLEIYVVQMFLIKLIMSEFMFPVNIMISLCSIVIFACIVNTMAIKIRKKLSFI